MSSLCDASDRKLAHDAEKVAERLRKGLPVYKCGKCGRLSHKTDHLCEPVAVDVLPIDPKRIKEESGGMGEGVE